MIDLYFVKRMLPILAPILSVESDARCAPFKDHARVPCVQVMSLTHHLQDLNVIIGETTEQVRSAFLAMLRQRGVGNVRAVRDLPRLKEELSETAEDLVVISSDLDQKIFHAVQNLRRHTFGINPFTIVTMMAEPTNKSHLKQAASSGADDLLARPVSPGQIIERAKYIAYNRLPFVTLADYIGPDRWPEKKGRGYKSFEVVNTLRHKMDGKSLSQEELLAKIERGMRRVRMSQLDSFGLRLGQTCKLILKAYETDKLMKASNST